MGIFISHSERETIELGRSWACELPAGSVIGLIGDLGAGKTQLVKGIAKGLGITTHISSPSFTIVNEYYESGRRLVHIDLYRLETLEQISALGLEEYPGKNNLVVIEWAEKWFGVLNHSNKVSSSFPFKYRQAIITALDEKTRKIEYEDFGN